MTKKQLVRYSVGVTVALVTVVCLVAWLWISNLYATIEDLNGDKEEFIDAIAELQATVDALNETNAELIAKIPAAKPRVLSPTHRVTSRTFNRHPNDIPNLEELEAIGNKYGIPGKILLGMSLKESHQDNRKVSQANARGMFQIRPRTAKFLKIANIYDNYESADAAARYLAHLHKELFDKDAEMHNDHTLKIILAAYNAGPYKLIRVNGDYLPPNFKETRSYVRDIMGFYKGNMYYVRKGDTIEQIANKYDVHPEILISVNGRIATRLRYGTFLYISTNTYRVASGDTLYSIAKRLDTTVDHLTKVNRIASKHRITVGQVLRI